MIVLDIYSMFMLKTTSPVILLQKTTTPMILLPYPKSVSLTAETGVCDASILSQETDLLLLLRDDGLVLRAQTGGVAREDERVTVQTGAVRVTHSARVVDGVVVIVGIDHPVVVISSLQVRGGAPVSHLELGGVR